MATPIPRKTSSSASAPTAPSNAAASFAPGGLNDTLTKLREAIQGLSGGAIGSGPSFGAAGGLGNAGLGATSAGVAASARLGMTPVQTMAAQIQRTTTNTSQAFAASMAQVQRSWKRGAGSFASDFFDALKGQSRKRRGRGVAAGRATRRAFQSSVQWSRRQAKSLQRKNRQWSKRYHRMMAGVPWSGTRGSVSASARWGRSRRRARRGGSGWSSRLKRAVQNWTRRGASGAKRWNKVASQSVQRARKRGASLARRARRSGKTWSRWSRRTAQRSSQWARKATRRFARASGRWARRTRRNMGSSFAKWSRKSRQRSRVAWRRAGRAFARTHSPRAAFGAGAKALAGTKLTARAGEFGIALSAFTLTLKQMQVFVERTNEGNRHLGRYSGQIGMAFNQIGYADQIREMKLARSTEGAAVTLAHITNRSREIQGSFDRLSTGVQTRAASATGVLWNALMDPWAQLADQFTPAMNGADPQGSALARMTASVFSGSAGVGGFLGSLWGGSTAKEAFEAADRAFVEKQRLQLAGVAPTLDPWSEWTRDNMHRGPIRPARLVKL